MDLHRLGTLFRMAPVLAAVIVFAASKLVDGNGQILEFLIGVVFALLIVQFITTEIMKCIKVDDVDSHRLNTLLRVVLVLTMMLMFIISLLVDLNGQILGIPETMSSGIAITFVIIQFITTALMWWRQDREWRWVAVAATSFYIFLVIIPLCIP